MKLILGGQVLAGFSSGEHFPHAEAGTMKVIASANAQRLSYSPDTGTFVEAGVNAYVDPYFFLATTKGTDADALTAIDEAIGSALASPEMIKIVNNAIKSNPLNLGPDGTKAMMVDGLTNVGVLFAK